MARRVPRVRFTVRRMMVGVALAGFVLGLAVEIPRLWRRWLFCQERAELFAQCAMYSRLHWQQESTVLARTEAIIRWLDGLGTEPRSVASLIAASGDPGRVRKCFQLLGKR